MFWNRRKPKPANDQAAQIAIEPAPMPETWAEIQAPKPANDATPELEPHPLADMLPAQDVATYQALLESVRRDGLIEPIKLFEGKVLDGRHRLRACREAGVAPRFEILNGTAADAARFVLTTNVTGRRHLSESQRAFAAAQLHGMGGVTLDGAALTLNVSRRSVTKAKTVLTSGDVALIAAVQRGEMSVDAACKSLDTGSVQICTPASPVLRTAQRLRRLVAAGDDLDVDTLAELAALAGELAAITTPKSRLKVVK